MREISGRNRGLSLLAGLFVTVAATAAPAQEGPVTLGFTGAITGPFNEFGEGIRRGLEIAVEQWNANGGINGRPVALADPLDDQLVPDRAVQNMRRILDNPDVHAIIAPSGSGPTLAVIDMLEADGRPVCNTQAQTPLIVYPKGKEAGPRKNVFSVAISNTVEGQKLAEALSAYRNIGILHESTGYGVTGAQILKERLGAADSSIKVTAEAFNQRAPDMTAQLARVQHSGAEVLAVVGLGADLAVIRRNMARLNMTIPLFATAGGVTPPYIEGAGDLVAGTRAAGSKAMGANPYPPETQKFLDLYAAKFGKDRWWGSDGARAQIAIATTVGTAYDCANLLFSAIRDAGSTDPAAIVSQMETITGFTGAAVSPISFSAASHDALTTDGMSIFEMRATPAGMALLPLDATN